MKIRAVWELTRLDHGFMLAVAILIGAILSNKDFLNYQIKLLFAFLTALFLEASTFSLNDYLDLDIDKKNKRMDRPLVRGDIKPRTALVIFFILFPLGIIFSSLVNPNCFTIATVTGSLAILYDFKMKKVKYVGNLYIAYTTAIPFVFGSVSTSETVPITTTILALIAFLASLGREMMKDIIDMEGDKIEGVRSIPMYIGERNTRFLISILYFVSVSVSLLPFFLRDTDFYFNYLYLILIVPADAVFFHLSIKHISRERLPFEKYRRTSLMGMVLGLIAFLFGSLFRL